MKKLILLFALILNLNVFSQELKKTTTHKEIKKSENSSNYNNIRIITYKIITEVPSCAGVSKKGVRCPLTANSGGYCNYRICYKFK